jgi:hypothetical protein
VRELPDEENGKQRHARPFDDASGRGPAQQRRHRSGESSDEGRQGGYALQRRVDRDVKESGQQRQAAGDEVRLAGQPQRSGDDGQKPNGDAVSQPDPSGSHRAIGRALHFRVQPALDGLVQRRRSSGNGGDPDQGLEQSWLHAADAGAHGAEIKAGPTGQRHHQRDAQLEKLAVVDQQGCSFARFRRVEVRMRLMAPAGR